MASTGSIQQVDIAAKSDYHRPFTAKDINKTMRSAGVTRAAKHVGESVVDNDALKAIKPVLDLALYIAQTNGYRTVHPCHVEMANRHIYGNEHLPSDVLMGLSAPRKRATKEVDPNVLV
jgi:hypothetical protein